ncbi:MAG: S-layer homology domain-containing protein [Ruminococcaceae bacterium]|nr:S-layer homology domain-containing protein [Oscillospiraceae bacterium]
MKQRILSAFMAMVLVVSTAIPGFSADIKVNGFDDVDETNWAYENIMKCVEKGAINGTRNPDENGIGSFSPKDKVTMGTFMAVLARLVCPEKITGSPKTGESWSAPYYRALYNAKVLTSATTGGKYFKIARLDDEIDREAMAYLLVKCAEYMGETLPIDEYAKESIVDYSDVYEFYFEDTILRAYSNGLITGYDNDRFGPKDSMTREQMATVVCRLMKYAPRPQVDFKAKVDAYNAVKDYFYKSGMLKREVQIELAKMALQNTYLYKNSKGELCIKVDAFNIPHVVADAGWRVGIGVWPFYKNNPDMFMTVEDNMGTIGMGVSAEGVVYEPGAYRNDETDTPVKISDVGWVSLYVTVYHTPYVKEYDKSDSAMAFRTTSQDQTQVIGSYENHAGSKPEVITMDLSHIYKDLGLK